MSIAVESATLLFVEWCKENRIANTAANGSLVATYLRENHLPVSWKNFNAAFQALKGKLEILKTPEQLEKEKIEAVRQEIYRQTAEKLSPAKIDFTNPAILSKIATWCHTNEKGLLSVDRVLRAIEAHKFDEGFWEVPPADLFKSQEFVEGRFNHAKKAKQEESTEHGPFGRKNHALDADIDKELKEGFKKIRKGMDDEEGRRIAAVVEHQIAGYQAQGFNRIDYVKTEIIQGLLRKYSKKYGTGVIEAIRNLPDDPSAAENWLRRRL